MSDFIFQSIDQQTLLENEYFCLHGLQDYFDAQGFPRCKEDNKNILAKKIARLDNSIRHMIRISKDGQLHNPVSIYDDETHQPNKSYINNNSVKFKRVSSKVFEMYLNFLKTKNTAWLHNAEREDE